MYKFAAAREQENVIFGSAKPRHSEAAVDQWVAFMQNQGIQRVCCLLSSSQVADYSDLLMIYRQKFRKVCWAPIEDFQLVNRDTLIQQILPFLAEAELCQEKTVVHCSGGVGRTGQILAAWLVYKWRLSNREAIAAVKRTGRNPYEAAFLAPFRGKSPWKVILELNLLLDDCRCAGAKLT
jgi:protein-tyrosine phosphatase